MRQYADSDIGFVDASIVAVAERLNVRKIVTLDRRHFGLIRPRHCEAFAILP
jgi:predicted nucleic acid-binding protein